MRFLDGFSWAWLGLFVGVAIGMPLGSGTITIPDDGGFGFQDLIDQTHQDAWVLLIEESADRSPATARVLASDYFSGLPDRKLNFRLYDVDDPGLDASAKKAAKDAGLPALLLVSADGKLLWSGNQPPTAEAIDAIVKEKTGL